MSRKKPIRPKDTDQSAHVPRHDNTEDPQKVSNRSRPPEGWWDFDADPTPDFPDRGEEAKS
jgi:hypothetical protein